MKSTLLFYIQIILYREKTCVDIFGKENGTMQTSKIDPFNIF